MKRMLTPIVALFAAGLSGVSWACGACDEDKIAATYDHVLIETAIATHHQVVFVSIDESASAPAITRRIAAAASRVRGVVPGTTRTSLSPAAFSFSLDGKRKPESAVSDFARILGVGDGRLVVVRVMGGGA